MSKLVCKTTPSTPNNDVLKSKPIQLSCFYQKFKHCFHMSAFGVFPVIRTISAIFLPSFSTNKKMGKNNASKILSKYYWNRDKVDTSHDWSLSWLDIAISVKKDGIKLMFVYFPSLFLKKTKCFSNYLKLNALSSSDILMA